MTCEDFKKRENFLTHNNNLNIKTTQVHDMSFRENSERKKITVCCIQSYIHDTRFHDSLTLGTHGGGGGRFILYLR